jgi:hypothetical protein
MTLMKTIKKQKITEQTIKDSLNKIDDFYKSMMSQGYKLFDVDHMHSDDIKRLNHIYEEKETTIDKAFPFCLPKFI